MAKELDTACDRWSLHAENIVIGSSIEMDALNEIKDASAHFQRLANAVRKEWI